MPTRMKGTEAMAGQETNHVQLCTSDGRRSHFSMHEFPVSGAPSGHCMVHPTVIDSLEATRYGLELFIGEECAVIVTCCVRTDARNRQLAARLGWISQGGLVSASSRHLPRFGGVAVDVYAKRRHSGQRIPLPILEAVAREHFDFVKGGYLAHVHADNRFLRGAAHT